MTVLPKILGDELIYSNNARHTALADSSVPNYFFNIIFNSTSGFGYGFYTAAKVYNLGFLLAFSAVVYFAARLIAKPGVSFAVAMLATHSLDTPVLGLVARGVGQPMGIVAGQAWECESRVELSQYQRAKTGALFVASTCAGAQAAGADPQPWRALGEALGEAYQVADDIRDVMGADQLGKPVGQDAAHGRPSTAAELGLLGAVDYFRRLMQTAVDSVPTCPSRSAMQQLVLYESERLLPQSACDQIAVRAGQAAQHRAMV